MSDYLYDLAVSFAGEQRDFALSISSRLDASGYAIFYDDFEAAQLWGSDLSEKLGEIYEKQARYCLILVSHDYVNKKWTKLERRFAISRALEQRGEYILPIRMDDSALPGLSSVISYIDARNTSGEEIYRRLLQKLGPPDHISSEFGVTPNDQEQVRQIIHACYRRAIFTKMASEIKMEAMFYSLGECLARVQKIIPAIESPDLQFLGLTILSALDQLERYISSNTSEYSFDYSTEDKQQMDQHKLQIIQSLLQLRRRARVQILLPTSLEYYHFYAVDGANEPPRSY